jgi:hypothetical protein
MTVVPVGTAAYSKNAGAFTTYTNDTVVTFANGDTLAFRLTGASGDSMTIQVFDTTPPTNRQVGVNFTLSIL